MNNLQKGDYLLDRNGWGWYVEGVSNGRMYLRNDVGKELWRQVSKWGTANELVRAGFTLRYSRFEQTPAQVCELCGEAYDCYC